MPYTYTRNGSLPLVHVLCTGRSTVYTRFPVDIYPRTRDAWTCRPCRPVIAHPPCRFWQRRNNRAKAPGGTIIKELFLGMWCTHLVRTYGGILEQPAFSRLWHCANLPPPSYTTPPTKNAAYGILEWSFAVDQAQFGHIARKDTWLFIAGLHPKNVYWHGWTLHTARPTLATLTAGQRSYTPLPFAAFLIANAARCQPAPAIIKFQELAEPTTAQTSDPTP